MSGSHRLRRVAALAAATAIGLVGVLGGAGGTTVAVATPAAAALAPAQAGLADLNACVVSRKKAGQKPTLRLAVVVDESSSLKSSDSGNDRVTAANLLIAQLAQQGQDDGYGIDALVAGFASEIDDSTGFKALTPGSVGGFTAAVNAFAGRNTGQDTDYWNAVTGIRTLFADARGDADPAASACQAVVLLTDGVFDLTARDATKPYYSGGPIDSDDAVGKAVAAGKTDLCRAAGPVDALRADDVTFIAVGLQGGQSSAPDFSLLQRMATGEPSACGAEKPNGAFFKADDISDLLLIFGELADPTGGSTGPIDPKPVCATTVITNCPNAVHTFPLNKAFSSAKVRGAVDADGIEVYLSSPVKGSAPLRIAYAAGKTTGSFDVQGVTIDYVWYTDKAVTITMTRNSSTAWDGTWTAVFVDTTGQHADAVSKTQLSVQPDLFVDADVTGGTGAADKGLPRPGETNPFDFYLRNGADQKLTDVPDGLTVRAKAVLTPKAANATAVTVADALTGADLGKPFSWKAPADLPVGAAVLAITTTVTFSGTTYDPVVRQEDVTVLPPFSSPSAKSPVQFPRAEGVKPVTASLTLVAPATGTGCAWVDGATLTAGPADVKSVQVTAAASSEATCVEIGAGSADQQVELTLTPGASGNGDLTGTLAVHLKPQGQGAASVQQVRFTGSLIRPADAPVKWLAFAVAMIVGIGLPLLVFVVVRRRGARFPDQPISYVVSAVTISGSQLRPGGDTDRTLVRRDSPRRVVMDPFTARAVAGLRLTDGGHAEIEGPGVGIGAAPPYQREDRAVVPLALAGSWSVFVAAGSPLGTDQPVPGQLVLAFPARASDAQVEELRARAQQEFPDRLEQFTASMRLPPPPDPGAAETERLRQMVGATGDGPTQGNPGGFGEQTLLGGPPSAGAGAPGWAGGAPAAPPAGPPGTPTGDGWGGGGGWSTTPPPTQGPPPAQPGPPPRRDDDPGSGGGWWGSS